MPTRRALLVAFALATALPVAPPALADDTVVVFAAASLRNALDDVVAGYRAATGKAVTVSYAGSSTLARQIEQGAPADIFFSADRDWMTYLSDRKLIATDTERTQLGNEIVLIAPRNSGAGNVAIGNGLDLTPLLGADGRLAMANVDAVPAGKYGKAALINLGGWDKVAGRIVQADNVRAALAFVASGEAPLGIVYATDARAEPAVKVIGTFPADSHSPIVYPVALTATSTNPDARAFLAYLASNAAKPAYLKQGFTVLAPGS